VASKGDAAPAVAPASSTSDALSRLRESLAGLGVQRGVWVTMGLLSVAALVTYHYTTNEGW